MSNGKKNTPYLTSQDKSLIAPPLSKDQAAVEEIAKAYRQYKRKTSDDMAFDNMLKATPELSVMESDKTRADLLGYKADKSTKDIHTTLAAAGLVPGIGNVADIIDAALYGLEGDKLGFGLSLISAVPMLGLVSGGGKLTKGGKIAKVQRQQTTMVEKTQEVIKKYGGDPTDPKLVSDITDGLMETAEGLVKSGKEMDRLLEIGMDYEDALAYTVYKGSLEPKAIKAAEDMKKMGYTNIELYGKEAVDDMNQLMKRGKELYENVGDDLIKETKWIRE
jgi:hypothetical protein